MHYNKKKALVLLPALGFNRLSTSLMDLYVFSMGPYNIACLFYLTHNDKD
jgi:hypothetical protein